MAEDEWTIVTLMVHLQRQIDDMKVYLAERSESQSKAVDAAFTAAQTAMQTAFAAADKALDQRASTLDREFHEHLEQVRHENALAFLNSDKAVQAALASAKEAVQKAEEANRAKFESVNEFRAQLADQAASFMSRVEVQALFAGMSDRVARAEERLNVGQGQDQGHATAEALRRAGNQQVVSIIGAIIAVVSVAVFLILGLNN